MFEVMVVAPYTLGWLKINISNMNEIGDPFNLVLEWR